ncbi:hypothetical protein PC110_g19635 [Phytophthora cactorum]|uniref:Uncharacterized protein n=1 Tax=Phytophthora cactorum TaxID=29920 RepID=A0A329RGV1_9STRA|nr:hypothetical protein PC111_g19067 [Phytophthora cactorum]KAG2891432.1 hypothetical protein PC115_g19207 [Phytophthora cactorum]RAW23935.1 hypothetical protein PC110_g19635 [Phytophthora cactorum]
MQNALDSNHVTSGTTLGEDTESASDTSAAATVFADIAVLVAAVLVAAVLAAGTRPVAAWEQVVGEAPKVDTTPVEHTAHAVQPATALGIVPAARWANAERTELAADLALAAEQALMVQAATAAG